MTIQSARALANILLPRRDAVTKRIQELLENFEAGRFNGWQLDDVGLPVKKKEEV